MHRYFRILRTHNIFVSVVGVREVFSEKGVDHFKYEKSCEPKQSDLGTTRGGCSSNRVEELERLFGARGETRLWGFLPR